MEERGDRPGGPSLMNRGHARGREGGGMCYLKSVHACICRDTCFTCCILDKQKCVVVVTATSQVAYMVNILFDLFHLRKSIIATPQKTLLTTKWSIYVCSHQFLNSGVLSFHFQVRVKERFGESSPSDVDNKLEAGDRHHRGGGGL